MGAYATTHKLGVGFFRAIGELRKDELFDLADVLHIEIPLETPDEHDAIRQVIINRLESRPDA